MLERPKLMAQKLDTAISRAKPHLNDSVMLIANSNKTKPIILLLANRPRWLRQKQTNLRA
jgi:hypothetical protein